MNEEPPNPLTSALDEHFQLPQLVDHELAAAIVKRGHKERNTSNSRIVWYLLGGALFGFVLTLLQFHAIIPLTIGITAAAMCVCALMAQRVQTAVRGGHYDLAQLRLPRALSWNHIWLPFSYYSYLKCEQLQLNLILHEGRYTELELLSLFQKGFTQRSDAVEGAPKNWAVANNLALANMLQLRYDPAVEIFSHVLERTKKKNARILILSNMAFCRMRENKLSEAKSMIEEAIALDGSTQMNVQNYRLFVIKAQIHTLAKELEPAERLVDELKANSALDSAPELVAYLDMIMAEIRFAQERYEEARLFYHNNMDVSKSANNPNYFALASKEREYSKYLAKAGATDEAEQAMKRAQDFFNTFLQREIDTVDLIKGRLARAETIKSGAELLCLAKREPYFPAIKSEATS